MRRAGWVAALCLLLAAAGCGGDDDDGGGDRPAGSDAGGEPTMNRLPEGGPGTERGRELVSTSGCLACHMLGDTGNGAPGPDLTEVGSRLSREEIARVLVDPRPPMPSFERLPEADRSALAGYLASLR